MKAKRIICAAAAAAAALTACSTKPSVTVIDEPPESDPYYRTTGEMTSVEEGVAVFTNELFQRCCQNAPGENTLVSPLSVYMAIGMVGNGAGSTTRSEIEKVLSGGDNYSMDEINAAMSDRIDKSDKGGLLRIANAMFVMERDDVTINPSFEELLTDQYHAELFYEPYSPNTVTNINAWASKHTKKMIPNLLDPTAINETTVSVLLNAIALEGEWKTAYDPDSDVQEMDFHCTDGTTRQAQFLHSSESLYIETSSAVGFVKPYSEGKDGSRLCFAAFLPNEDTPLDEFIADLNSQTIIDGVENAQITEVIAELPKFTFDGSCELNSTLTAMGMESAFDGKTADFSQLGTYDGGNISIGQVIHKTHIELDEKGTKAAAATAITMKTNDAMAMEEEPKFVTLDRPFLFTVYDLDDHCPVFIGALYEP